MKYNKETLRKFIPGGCHTYSKGEDTFSDNVPDLISKGKGAYVWDQDNNKFLDFTMGLTSVTLGHSFKEVDDFVIKNLRLGLNFQRPSKIELDYAYNFLKLLPNHQMIKFAKNGSTVTTAATKLARAFTKRKLIAFPFDQPFFSYDDWFIGKTKCDLGVPEEIKNLSVTFKSCSMESLNDLFERHPNQIACVIMEPTRSNCYSCNCSLDNESYLKKAIELTRKNGSIFILDEMITGFKASFPGITTKYNLDTDITTWGKSISNGYSFACMTGKQNVMSLGGIESMGKEKLFLTSTTHGAETVGIAGALATLNFYNNNNVISKNLDLGLTLIEKINKLIKKYKLLGYIKITNCPWMISFLFDEDIKTNSLIHSTFFTQQMIKKKILIQNSLIVSYSHSEIEIEIFIEAFESFLETYQNFINSKMYDFELTHIKKPVFRKYI
ncbi:aminotransferase class III-fold pyridoxal phosphate-dependent enzyme [Flavobacteriaceae bacterium]|nr:aminotransferase class III-fold pyridoxal phosphate-dependent enzyme [Flavobacteriaceae bacterium]